MAKLNREIDELEQTVSAALRSRLTDSDRRKARSEIEIAMQRLDELRSRLSG
ncbi:MAG TPA: hypothetical protein VL418_13765 [Devosiaceae bacterium]|nr:hypothetical protein [Devosiaceae bacterium]